MMDSGSSHSLSSKDNHSNYDSDEEMEERNTTSKSRSRSNNNVVPDQSSKAKEFMKEIGLGDLDMKVLDEDDFEYKDIK